MTPHFGVLGLRSVSKTRFPCQILAPVFFVWSFVPLCQGQTTTSGACSPVVSGNGNSFTFNCTGIDERTAKQMLSLLNTLLAREPDRRAVMTRLDSILDGLKRASQQQRKDFANLNAQAKCNTATPQNLASAIKARDADRIVTLWSCAPENGVVDIVQFQVAYLFEKDRFSESTALMQVLHKAGWKFLMDGPPTWKVYGWMNYGWSPVYIALQQGNEDGLNWLIQNAPAEYWKKYPTLIKDIPQMHLRNPEVTSGDVRRIEQLQANLASK